MLNLLTLLCDGFMSRSAEGAWPDWQEDRPLSLAPLSAHPWPPHKERPRRGPYLDPQEPHPSPCPRPPLRPWGSMSTVGPRPHPPWGPLVWSQTTTCRNGAQITLDLFFGVNNSTLQLIHVHYWWYWLFILQKLRVPQHRSRIDGFETVSGQLLETITAVAVHCARQRQFVTICYSGKAFLHYRKQTYRALETSDPWM